MLLLFLTLPSATQNVQHMTYSKTLVSSGFVCLTNLTATQRNQDSAHLEATVGLKTVADIRTDGNFMTLPSLRHKERSADGLPFHFIRQGCVINQLDYYSRRINITLGRSLYCCRGCL